MKNNIEKEFTSIASCFNKKMEESKEISFNDLFCNSLDSMKSKLKVRLSGLKKIKPANESIELPTKFRTFLFDAIRWIESAIEAKEDINENEFFKEFKLSESGDIFKGESQKDIPSGRGICITSKNEMIEAKFKHGKIVKGEVKILYSNGEYYSGFVKDGGIKEGKGFYYYSNGDIYDGEFIDNKRVGKSRLRFKDGSEYIGQFIEDEADGHGIFNDKEGNRYMSMVNDDKEDKAKEKESGYFLKGKLFGKGEIKYKNGNTYQGRLKGSLRHGYGKMSFESAQIIDGIYEVGEYMGQWKRDKRHGNGTMFSNGTKFFGVWKNDKKYEGEQINFDGTTYKGSFKRGEFHGQGTIKFTSGKSISGIFNNGDLPQTGKIEFSNGDVFEGIITDEDIGKEGKIKYTNGDVYRGNFLGGHRHGQGIMNYDNQSKYEGRWQNDKKHGLGKYYNSTKGEIFEGMFMNDKREGEGKLICSNGEVYEGTWYGNKRISPKKPTRIVSKEEYFECVNRFLKEKSVLEPEVKIML